MKKRIILAVITSGIIIILAVSIKAIKKWERYVIEAGSYTSIISTDPIPDLTQIEFNFRTNPTWYFNGSESPEWRKIRGLSNGHHQKNSSAYLAYHCIDDSLLLIGVCCTIDGVSPVENEWQQITLDTIHANSEYSCKIVLEDGLYKIYFEDKYWDCPAGKKHDWGYRVNPFVEPEFTLEHDWMVDLLDF